MPRTQNPFKVRGPGPAHTGDPLPTGVSVLQLGTLVWSRVLCQGYRLHRDDGPRFYQTIMCQETGHMGDRV